MSFSGEVKRELLALSGQAVHCQAAELAAMLSGAGHICRIDSPGSVNGPGRITGCEQGGRMHMALVSENEPVVCRYANLLAQAAGIMVPVTQERNSQQKNKVFYAADITEKQEVHRLLAMLHCTDDTNDSDDTKEANHSNHTDQTCGICTQADAQASLLKKSCCKRAFLRGAFLVSGSISNPKRSYHFEIVCADAGRAQQICQQFGSFGLEAKTVTRKNHEVVYLKEGAQIVDALNIIGAHTALMNLENVRIIKEMRNDINRRVNCETANINKTVNAAYRQQEAIRFLHQKGLLEQLPQQLKEIAALRMEYPEAAIRELGTLCHPPVGKSGVNHRLRKLEEIAGQQGYEKKE